MDEITEEPYPYIETMISDTLERIYFVVLVVAFELLFIGMALLAVLCAVALP